MKQASAPTTRNDEGALTLEGSNKVSSKLTSSGTTTEKLTCNLYTQQNDLISENMSTIGMMSSSSSSSGSSNTDNNPNSIMGQIINSNDNNHNQIQDQHHQHQQSIIRHNNGCGEINSSGSENGSHISSKVDTSASMHFAQAAALQQFQQQHLLNLQQQHHHHQYMNQPPHPQMFMPRLYRKGKWTQEEEEFTKALITAFNDGHLAIPLGTTLRSFLSEKLNCDPMRITKKFSGDHSIGKQMYQPTRDTLPQVLNQVQQELKDLEQKFIATVEPKGKNHTAVSGAGLSMTPEFLAAAAPHMFSQFLQAHAISVGPSNGNSHHHHPALQYHTSNTPAPSAAAAAAAAAAAVGSIASNGLPPMHPAIAAANIYCQQAVLTSGSLPGGIVPPMIGSVLNTTGNGDRGGITSSSSDEDNNDNNNNVNNNDNDHNGNISISSHHNGSNHQFFKLPNENSMSSSVNDQMASLTSSVPPLDMNVYFAQYQMEALAQAKAYALAQAHAYESYAVEQAQKNDYSDTYEQKKGNTIYPCNDSDSSGGSKEKCSSSLEDRIEEAEKKEAKDSELLLNFFEASKKSGLVPPRLGGYNFSGLPTLSEKIKITPHMNSQLADVTSKEDSSHDSNNSNNNGSDSLSNERESDLSETSSDLDNNAPNSSVSDSNSNDTPPPEEKRDESDGNNNLDDNNDNNVKRGSTKKNNKRYLSSLPPPKGYDQQKRNDDSCMKSVPINSGNVSDNDTNDSDNDTNDIELNKKQKVMNTV